MASAGKAATLDDWKRVAERLAAASETLRPLGMRAGFHNHQTEFKPIDGNPADRRDREEHAAGLRAAVRRRHVRRCRTGPGGVDQGQSRPDQEHPLQGLGAGEGPDKGYKVLTGEGVVPWKEIRAAAESVGGVETYLIEQEGSRFTPFETIEKCLATWKGWHREAF